jgi:tRNA G18 (ribose-2'-O)-methylase SpoU
MLPKIYLICQNIRRLHNVGSIFRSADAFGVEKIYLCGYTGCPPHPDISKTALGAEKTVPWEQRKQTHQVIEELKNQGVFIVALEQIPHSLPLVRLCPGRDIMARRKKHGLAIILGNEVKGLGVQDSNKIN